MSQFLVVTKDKSYLIDADEFGIFDATDGRRSVYKFFNNVNRDNLLFKYSNAELVASFDCRNVKVVIKQ